MSENRFWSLCQSSSVPSHSRSCRLVPSKSGRPVVFFGWFGVLLPGCSSSYAVAHVTPVCTLFFLFPLQLGFNSSYVDTVINRDQIRTETSGTELPSRPPPEVRNRNRPAANCSEAFVRYLSASGLRKSKMWSNSNRINCIFRRMSRIWSELKPFHLKMWRNNELVQQLHCFVHFL